MKSKEIEAKINYINELYNKTNNKLDKKVLEYEHDELLTRLSINDFLIYGYGLKTFIEQDYSYTKGIELKRLKELWKEQVNMLGGLD